jgi:hypothetical protein
MLNEIDQTQFGFVAAQKSTAVRRRKSVGPVED